MTAGIARLADLFFGLSMERDPIEGAQLGLTGCESVLPDVSPEAREGYLARLDRLSEELAALPSWGGAQDADDVTARVLAFEIESLRSDLKAAWSEFTVDATFVGPTALLLSVVPKVQVGSTEQLERYLTRLRAVPAYLEQAVDSLRMGSAVGRFSTRAGVEATVMQVSTYLALALTDDPFVAQPVLTGVAEPAARARIAQIVGRAVRPAFDAYRQVLIDDFMASSRDDDAVGLIHVPGGEQAYLAALRRHTTTGLDADGIHQAGLSAVAEIQEEVAALAPALGLTARDPVLTAYRERSELSFGSASEMVRHCKAALRRAQAALPDVVSDVPLGECHLRVMNDAEARTGALAYYQPPSRTGDRPGTYWLNTYDPGSRVSWEYEALTFHESVPGHHTQTSIAHQMAAIPDFRRFGYLVAYSEGWALYAERLCDELGLYSGPADRLGMLSFALWRACRLVVDTGLHQRGWSRERAISYLLDNTGLTMANVRNEVDRYIAWPGQATGYFVGYQRIRALRDSWSVGGGTTARSFHDRMLVLGPLPFTVLEDLMAPGAR